MSQSLKHLQLTLVLAAFAALFAVDGSRIKQQHLGDKAGEGLLGYKPGDIVDGFRLDEHVGNIPMADNPALAVASDSPFYVDDGAPSSALLEEDAATNATSAGRPLVSFPRGWKKLISPVHLGAGSFGESWLVTGGAGSAFEGRQVVAKFLYIEVSRGKYRHVTKEDVSRSPVLRKEVHQAAVECNFAKELQKAALRMNSTMARNAQRLMACYSHNFLKKTGRHVPIYLILENCGADDLEKYIEKNRDMSKEVMGSIVKQILEGLEYLSAISVIHHDLKPANIVVKEIRGSSIPTVHLIDFGAMMHAHIRLARSRTVATTVFAPPEWFRGYAFKVPASSFDMYAVGNILAEMAFGSTFSSLYYDRHLDEPDWTKLDSISGITSRSEFCGRFHGPGLTTMSRHLPAYNFIRDFWVRMIKRDPAERPAPAEVLAAEWIAESASPNDPGWVMYSPPAATPEVSQEDAEEDDAQDTDGCLPACDLCLKGDGHWKIRGTNPAIFRPRVVCAVEIEHVNPTWVKNGINKEFCSSILQRLKVGRNKHGKQGELQEYYTWDCAEMTKAEIEAES
jgi:serine/threonine protein kinase